LRQKAERHEAPEIVDLELYLARRPQSRYGTPAP
jgi:hypothetical protein